MAVKSKPLKSSVLGDVSGANKSAGYGFGLGLNLVIMDRSIALLIMVLSVGIFALWGLRTVFSESANPRALQDRPIKRSLPVRQLDPMLWLFGVGLLLAVIVYLVRGAG